MPSKNPTQKFTSSSNIMTYKDIAKGIKDLTIQGAEAIAVAAVDALSQVLASTTDQKKIAEYGAKKILNGMIVFTHCHSSTVERILIEAHKQGKKFTVYNTETRPKFQGRKTATNLAKAGIKVVHMVDSAGRTALKKADLFLYGCDSLSSEGKTINKIGTEALAEFCNKARIPVYCCTNTWKFNPETITGFDETIELRDPKEVWPEAPKGVTIFNPAFEIISPDIITGCITEIGIFKPESIVNRIAVVYPWLVA